MEIEKIEMNQAIAACNKGSRGFIKDYKGVVCLWQGGAGGNPTIYPNLEVAMESTGISQENAFADYYQIYKKDGSNLVHIEDKNFDGHFDYPGIDNVQNGEWDNSWSGMFES